MEQPFRGMGVALVTPFRNGKVDFEALERVIEHVISGEADFLVSLGTTGEATTLNPEEARQVIRHTVECNRGRLPPGGRPLRWQQYTPYTTAAAVF